MDGADRLCTGCGNLGVALALSEIFRATTAPLCNRPSAAQRRAEAQNW